jgi:hypothetical protein
MKIFSFLILFSLFFVNLFAQDDAFLYENFSVKYTPTNIREGELVKFYIISGDFDLSLSNITWTVNGKKADEGIGRINFETNAGKVGKSVVVKVNVKNDIFDENKEITITPNTTFILHEGVNSYVPPFYKGRALPNKEDFVRMAAISFQNSEIADFGIKKNNYKWSVNNEEQKNDFTENQIIHKTQASFVDNSLNIKVRKETLTGQKVSDSVTNILIQSPDPVIYKTDAKKLIKQEFKINEKGNDFYLFVEPYFLSGESRYDKKFSYLWEIDGLTQNTKNPWFVNIKGIKDKIAEISLKINQNKKVTQNFEKTFRFNFE